MAALPAKLANARLWIAFDRLVLIEAIKYGLLARPILRKEGEAAALAFEAAGEAAALATVTGTDWPIWYDRLFHNVLPKGGNVTADWLGVTIEPKVLTAAADGWIRVNAREHIVGLIQTSRDEIERSIAAGREANESRAGIADRIRAHRAMITKERARLAGHTETHAAANHGSLVAAHESQLPLDKVWLATPDNRTRDAHRAAHMQRRPLDKPFLVYGEYIQCPGQGSPKNTARCRCTMGYAKQEGAGRFHRRPRVAVAA